MRGEIHLQRSLGVAQVQLQRQGRDEQEGKRGEQGEAVGRFDGLDPEDAFQGSENEGAGDQSRDEGIEEDEDAPLELDLVGIHEALDRDLQRASLPR